MYPLANADVATMVTQLQQIFSGQSNQRGRRGQAGRDESVTVVGDETGNRVIVSAPAEKHALIAEVISDVDSSHDGDQVTIRIHKIENGDATSMAQALSTAWNKSAPSRRGRGSSGDAGAVRLTADRGSNSIVVRAPSRDHSEIARLVEEMDVSPQDKYPVQSIPLANADASNLARILSSVFSASTSGSRGRRGGSTSTPLVIEADDESRMLLVRADEETFVRIRALAGQMDASPSSKTVPTVIALEEGRAESLAVSLNQAFAPQRGQRLEPGEYVNVVAEPTSNTLIVTANEENLQKVRGLLKTMLAEGAAGVRTEFVLLKNAKAVDLADVLERIASAQSGGSSSRRGRRGQASGQGVTISADAASNALLMTGPSGELDKMMKMALQLDQAVVTNATGAYIIPLKNGQASDVAATVSNLYRAQADAARREKRSIDALAVSADERANAVVLATTQSMYQQVLTWVTELENMKPARGEMRIIPIENADPYEVQRAIQQMFGEQGASNTNNRNNRGRRNEGGGTAGVAGQVETSVLEQQRAIMITASEEDYKAIAEMVRALDRVAAMVEKTTEVIALKHAANTRVAQAMNSLYSGEQDPKKQVKVNALAQTNALVISAAPDRMKEVADLVAQLDKPEVSPQVQVRIYPLEHAQPGKVLPMVQQILQQVIRRLPGETFTATADDRTRAIIVTARQDVFDAVAEVIKKLDNPPAFASAVTKIFPLAKADAPRLAGVINEMLRPSTTNQVTPEARALQEQLRRLKVSGAIDAATPELDLSKPIKVTSDPAQPGQQGSNSLIITSTEDNLKAMGAVVSLLDMAPLAEGVRVRIIALKNADAASVMSILKDIFDQGRRLAGREDTSVSGRAEPDTTVGKALVNPLNISADLRTNTLVLAGIEESVALAEVVIQDLDKQKGKIETQVKLFQLEHVAVERVAAMIGSIFAEQVAPEVEGLRTQVTRLRTILDKQAGQDGHVTELPRSRQELIVRAEPATNILIVAARSDVMPLIADVVGTIDLAGAKSDHAVRFFPLENADASRVQQLVQTIFASRAANAPKPEDVPTLAVDARTNALVASASEKSLEQVAALVKRLDIETPVDLRDIQLIPLENADSASLADVLQQMMDARVQRQQSLGVKDAEALRVIVLPDPRSNSLIVGGSKESFDVVASLARQLDAAGAALAGQLRIFPLTQANADIVAQTLSNLFNQRYAQARTPDVQRQKPIILPDMRTNALLVAANKDDTGVIESLLKRLDVKLADPAVRLEVVSLEHNDASIVAPMLQEVFDARLAGMTPRGAQPSPADQVDVAVDSMTNSLIVSANKDNFDLLRGLVARLDRQPSEKDGVVQMFALKNSDAQRVATMLESLVSQGLYKPGIGLVKDTPALSWREKVAITVDTRTNVLIISASEQNLKILGSIIERVDSSADYSLLGDIRVYPLQRADASELAPTLTQFFQAKRQAEQQAGSTGRSLPVSIVADARTNALLVAGSRESFAAIEQMIQRLDREDVPEANRFKVVSLTNASASNVAETLRQLFAQRVTRGQSADPFTILPDALTNSLVLGGSAEDMKLAQALIERLDKPGEKPGRSIRVFTLDKADATRTAETIRQLYQARGDAAAAGVAISVDERINAIIVSGGQGDLEYVGDLVEQLDRKGVTQVTEIRFFQLKNADAEEMAEILTAALINKPAAMTEMSPNLQTMLQFVVTSEEGKKFVAQALEEGVLITPDARTNTLIVKARKDFMDLLARLIDALDSTDPRKAEIVVFPLGNADARSMADILSQLFRLEGTTPTNKAVRYTLTSGQGGGEGATIGTDEQHALSLTVDPRTNALLVGGTRQYVQLVSQVIRELDSSPAQERLTKVYRLRNAQSEQIEAALSDFLDQERDRVVATLGDDAVGAAMRLLEREVAVVAEQESNSLLLSASPRYFKTVEEIIRKLDQPPPQVLIQVLLAELTLDDTSDFGFDWDYTDEIGSKNVSGGTSFGVEANLPGLTGLTLSVTGGDLSFFLRALQSQGRLQVLSRPQILASDNQEAEINVGQSVPFITESSISDSGRINNTIEYQDVGILLNVTPRINDDGFVRLEVEPEISSLSQSTVQVSENVNAVIVNRRSARTTVTVQDGHTIVLGGLITTTDENREDKVPILGDMPVAGNLFRSVKKVKRRSELLIILKPHVLRTTEDADIASQPQIRRVEMMSEERDDMLRKAVIESLDTDPEMLDSVRRELEKRRSQKQKTDEPTPAVAPDAPAVQGQQDESGQAPANEDAGPKPVVGQSVPLENVAP
ncbi:MAG: secretin N-terminal domain-containing protein [Planctomycetota bacterium]